MARAEHILVVGGGLIGAGWAAAFAGAGLRATVLDPDGAAVHRTAAAFDAAQEVMRALGQWHDDAQRPEIAATWDDVARAITFVQESLPEDLAVKQAALIDIEARIGDEIVVASSSSGLKPSILQAQMRRPERLVVGHPCNPPYLMPTVEVCGGTATATAAIERAADLYATIGKTVLRLASEVEGHLVNRLQFALWREMVHLAETGAASLADLERAVSIGLAPRWLRTGPSMVCHLAGGGGGMDRFLSTLGPAVEGWWATLGTPRLSEKTGKTIAAQMSALSQGLNQDALSRRRDETTVAALKLQKSWLEAESAATSIKGR